MLQCFRVLVLGSTSRFVADEHQDGVICRLRQGSVEQAGVSRPVSNRMIGVIDASSIVCIWFGEGPSDNVYAQTPWALSRIEKVRLVCSPPVHLQPAEPLPRIQQAQHQEGQRPQHVQERRHRPLAPPQQMAARADRRQSPYRDARLRSPSPSHWL
jgi:hypothetical protein